MRTLPWAVALGLLVLSAGCMLDSSSLPAPAPGESAAVAKTRRQKVIDEVKRYGGNVQVGPGDAELLVVSADLHGFQSAAKILRSLTPLTKLRVLNLYNTGFTDADLELVRGLPTLAELNLNGNSITDAGLERLRGIPNLRKLCLNDTLVTDAGITTLRDLANLQELTLGGSTRITDVGVVQLHDLKKLENLQLHGDGITDRSLESLRTVVSLRELYLVRTRVTDAGVNELKKALPKLQVTR